MDWKAKWIWDSGEESPKNAWLCFRKIFVSGNDSDSTLLHLTADSRYYLYVNGKSIGYGPSRSWPFEQSFDTYEINHLLNEGENVIAVLVNHYGTSTTQYVHGRGGFIVQLDIIRQGATVVNFVSDKSWKVCRHLSFNRNTGRINVAFPWIEEFDSRKFDGKWNQQNFDDTLWENAVEIGTAGMEPWVKLMERDIPPLSSEIKYPQRVEGVSCVKPQGQHVCIDFAPNFYPDCHDSKDKKQLGYIITIIHSPKQMIGVIKHLSKKWPEVTEKIKVNGHEYIFSQGETEKSVQLEKGENFFIVDISGGYQRFELALLFVFEMPLVFRIFYEDEFHSFLTMGPFDFKPVHNIAAMEGIVLNDKMQEYIEAWKVKNVNELYHFKSWLKPVSVCNISTDNVAIMSKEKCKIKSCKVIPQTQNMVKANEEFSLFENSEYGDTEIVIDFGEETSGFIEIDIESDCGIVFDFNLFECMHNGNIEYMDGINNSFRYISRNGRQTYRSFIKRGFRYVMLTLRKISKSVKIFNVRVITSGYPAIETGSFICSDYILNEIWKICQRTLKLCMDDAYMDCPGYEQSFWLGDSLTSFLISNYLFGSYDLAKRCLLLAAKSLERSELPEAQVPTGCNTILTAWCLLWLTACRKYHEFTGDLEFIETIYPYMKKTVENFSKHIDNKGLLNINAWNLLDWAEMDTPADGIVTHQNALLVKSIRDVAFISEALGMNENARKFEMLADSIKTAINQYLWDEDKQAYIDCIHSDGSRSDIISAQTNLMVYICECAQDDRHAIIEKYLWNTPNNFVKIGSPFMSFFYYEALIKSGSKCAVEQIVNDIRVKWGEMLEYGATTCWETFLGFYKYTLTRSHCHAWSAAPGYYLGAYLLGIRPAEPGFESIVINPNLAGLNWAKGTVPTPKGTIYVELKDDCGKIKVNLRLPEGMQYSIDTDVSNYNVIYY